MARARPSSKDAPAQNVRLWCVRVKLCALKPANLISVCTDIAVYQCVCGVCVCVCVCVCVFVRLCAIKPANLIPVCMYKKIQ